MPPPAGPRPAVSVCIASTGRASLVERALPSVRRASDADVEVVVAFDGTGPHPRLPTGPPIVVLDAVGPPTGPGATRNRAAGAATRPFLLFLDDDDELLPGGVDRLLALATPEVDLVSGASDEPATARHAAEVVRPVPLGPLHGGVVASVLAGSFAVRRATFDVVGGYDERLRFGENGELSMRLGQAITGAGRQTAHTSELVVRHHRSDAPYAVHRAMAATVVLERHADLLAGLPGERAKWEGLAGVAHVRAGERREGRRHLWRAVRARPRDPKAWARAGVALIPPAADRVWGRGRA